MTARPGACCKRLYTLEAAVETPDFGNQHLGIRGVWLGWVGRSRKSRLGTHESTNVDAWPTEAPFRNRCGCPAGRTLLPYLHGVATRVLLAEDSFIVREGIRLLLETTEAVDLIAATENLDELMIAVEKHRPDVVLTDIRMPPTRTDEGIRAALEIRARWPEIGVVVLSQYAEPGYVLALFEHGSAGLAYLLKERVGDLGELVRAIEEVLRDGSVIDPKVVDVLVAARSRRAGSKLDRLTPREGEVLEHVAEGKTNAAIARDLYLSERAVEKHINSIFTKLDLSFEEDVNKRVRAVVLWLAERSE